MTKTEEIKKIPVLSVLDKLGIKYSRKGSGEYALYDGDGKTSGRSANEQKNIIRDFSHDRGQGDTFGFVKSILSMSDKETFEWFDENFAIRGEKTREPIRFLREGLGELKQEHIDYLQKRKIDYNKIKSIVKNYRNSIGCLVYKNGLPKGLRARTLSEEHNKRFFSASGYEGEGLYMHELDKEKDYIIVVEGLVDFLTLRQYESNVVGLTNNQQGYEDVKRLGEIYKIIICPDNDDAGYQGLEQLKGTKYSIFNVGKYGEYKDINDFYMEYESDQIIQAILDDAKEILPIYGTFDKLYENIKIIKEQGKLGIDGPIHDVYEKTSGVIPGKVYTIGAYSNVGKSKIAYYHTQYFLKQDLSVLFINLEIADNFCLGEIINSYYNITRKDLWNGYNIDKSKFRNLIVRDDIYDLDKIINEIDIIRPNICFIDFVQNIQVKGSKGYEKNAEIATAIQRIAIKTGTTIYSLSQISNSQARDLGMGNDGIISLKGAGEYTASSDVIFILKRSDREGILEFIIEKNKFGKNKIEFDLAVDFERNQFNLLKKPF